MDAAAGHNGWWMRQERRWRQRVGEQCAEAEMVCGVDQKGIMYVFMFCCGLPNLFIFAGKISKKHTYVFLSFLCFFA